MKKRAIEGMAMAVLFLTGCDMSAAERASGPVSFPDPDSAGARLLVERCAGCHAAPQPSVHTAQKWPSVVYRMQQRMVSKARPSLSKDEMAVLIDYLQQHAGRPQ